MTILKQPLENVIDWSMTIFARIGNGLSQKIVIDRSMTIFEAVQLGVGQSRESLTYLFDYGHTLMAKYH